MSHNNNMTSAEEWGLEKPLFTGHLKLLQADTKMRIVVYRYKDESTLLASDENLVQFAECPIEIQPKEESALTKYVDSVADSSRYFVIRLVDILHTQCQWTYIYISVTSL